MIFFSLLASWNLTDGPKKANDQSCCPPVRTLHERDPHCARGPCIPGQHQCSRRMGGGWRLHIHGPDAQASPAKAGRVLGAWEKDQGIRSAFVQAFLGIQPAGIEHGWHYFELGHQGPWARSIQWNYIKEIVSQLRFHQRWWTCPWGILQRDGQDDRSHATNWYWLFSSV